MLILFHLLSQSFLLLVAEGQWGKKINKILNLFFYVTLVCNKKKKLNFYYCATFPGQPNGAGFVVHNIFGRSQ